MIASQRSRYNPSPNMKYLCFAVVFLYAVLLHSAMAGCVTPEQFEEGMDIAERNYAFLFYFQALTVLF